MSSRDSSVSAARLLERGASELERFRVSDSKLQAEVLLRHALGCSRESLLARLQDAVPAEASGHFFQLIERRGGRVPLQYIVGTQEFYGLEFRVTPAVLIPRPETECLVDETIAALSDLSQPIAVDVGCGSGCVAIAVARECPSAEIVAIDTSPAALAIARENARRHDVAERIRFLEGSLLEPLEHQAVDAVVSNPPYVTDRELATLEPEVAEHEPREALAGGPDGLSVIRPLLVAAHASLRKGGKLLMEMGQGQDDAVRAIARDVGLEPLRTAKDLAGIPRVLVAVKPERVENG